MPLDTVEAFAERASTAITQADREGYKALFDLPCAVWGDNDCDLRTTESGLDQVFDRILGALERMGRPRHRLRIDGVRLLGDRLTVVRALTWLEATDSLSRTDPSSELWVLREIEGVLRLVAIVNPMSMHVLSGEPAPRGIEPVRPLGGPATPAQFVAALEAVIRNGDRDAHERLLSLPYLRFTDQVTGVLLTPEQRRAMIDAAYAIMQDKVDAVTHVRMLAERPYGRTLFCLRMQFDGLLNHDAQLDPREELWILRDAGQGLQLCGVVNPVTDEIIKTEDHFLTGDDLQ